MPDSKQSPSRFVADGSVSSFAVDSPSYLRANPDFGSESIATGALVFDRRSIGESRILLVQRSGSDSSPNKWEIPGGACDDGDESILQSVARELWEETGLAAAKIGPVVGDVHHFTTRSGKEVGKFVFFVEVEKRINNGTLDVKLCPDEHQAFVWATETQVRALRAGDIDLEFASPELLKTVLEAFRMKRVKEA